MPDKEIEHIIKTWMFSKLAELQTAKKKDIRLKLCINFVYVDQNVTWYCLLHVPWTAELRLAEEV